MEEYVTGSFLALLSPSDRERYQQPGEAERDGELSTRIFAAVDKVILERAPTLGWRLFFSPMVTDRLAQWFDSEPNGPVLFEKLGKALTLGALVGQRKAKLPVSPWIREFKQKTLRELRTLQGLLRTMASSKPSRTTAKDWRDAVAENVHRHERPFPQLLVNWTAFQNVLKFDPETFKCFCFGDLTPGLFVDQWIAWEHNRETESMRQAISNVHSRRSRLTKL